MRVEDQSFLQLFAGAESRADLWRRVLHAMNARVVLEAGVWKGEFAQQVLSHCEFIQRYYMIDPWAKLPDWNKPFNVATEVFEEVYQEAMSRTDFAAAKRVVLRGRTKEVVEAIPDDSLDFAYVDGDHTLRGITIDLIRILPKIRDGGLIAGDDFTDTPWQHKAGHEPTLVCPFSIYFAEAMDLPLVALPLRQFVIQKRRGASFSFIDTTGRFGDTSINNLLNSRRVAPVKRRLNWALAKLGLK